MVPDLTQLARQAMLEHGLVPDYPLSVKEEVHHIQGPACPTSKTCDLRDKLWFSLDNEDSKDLDQLTYGEISEPETFKVFIAIADVDSLVKKETAIDHYARQNTTSVYTPTRVFAMLPKKLSTHLTSLNEGEDRLAMVVEVDIEKDGSIAQYSLYSALVRNHAKLAYDSISKWLDGQAEIPLRMTQIPGLEKQVKLQDSIAQKLKKYRQSQGALTLETIEGRPKIHHNEVVDMQIIGKNRARNLIEDFMITANTATARFLNEHSIPSLRRIVRIPERWNRIIEIAQQYGERLPEEPNAKALDQFLQKRKQADPLRFPDLSLTVIKLLGDGEYIVEYPGDEPIGHFSLAVKDYTHSTAPNRRYPDLITQRLIKAVLSRVETPYSPEELEELARHCTHQEDEAEKVERKMRKSATILMLFSKIGETYPAIVTGASQKGTWVRVLTPPIEGKLVQGYQKVDVGDRLTVKLIYVDLEKGYIDFVRV
jgi:exoribonuclease-2